MQLDFSLEEDKCKYLLHLGKFETEFTSPVSIAPSNTA